MKEKRGQGGVASPTHAKPRPLVLSLWIPAVTLLGLIVTAGIAVGAMSAQMKETATRTLLSAAAEQRTTFDAALKGQISTLSAVSFAISEDDASDPGRVLSGMKKLTDSTELSYVGYAWRDGLCRFSNGTVMDISQREYFQKALEGGWSFQRVESDLHDGGGLFVMAVPIFKGGAVVGIVQGAYTEKALEGLMLSSAGKASSFICLENGDLLAGVENSEFYLVQNNAFASLEASGLLKDYSVEQFRRNVADDKIGSFEYTTNGSKRYAAYMPLSIQSATGASLFMLYIVPAEMMDASEHGGVLSGMVIAFVALIAGLTFFYFYRHERKNVRLLSQEREQLRVSAEQLRASEEQNRLAVAATSLNVSRYDLKTGVYYNNSDLLNRQGFGDVIENVPQAFIDAGLVAAECVDDFRAFYDNLRKGVNGVLFASLKMPDGHFRWFRKDATFVLDAEGKPYQAIVVYRDVTEQREKEAVFNKWQESINHRPPESYTLFRCNLSKGASFDKKDGLLLTICFQPELDTFNERTREYAGRFVHLEDFDAYVSLLNSENLLAGYYRGSRAVSMDYRERVAEGEYRWLRVTIEMAQYPDATDIEAFLLYEDINDAKLAELADSSRVEADPLTGVLNRSAFVARLDALLAAGGPRERHALILLDIDGFHALNDAFGYATGDQALVDIAAALRSTLSVGDLLGRFGGDVFLLCIKNAPNQTVAEKKVLRIQALMRKAYSVDVQLSASLGIAMFPDDGRDFAALYHSVDMALHTAKENGKDSFAFYKGDDAPAGTINASAAKTDELPAEGSRGRHNKRRLIVIDDDPETFELLSEQFGDEYRIEACTNATQAMPLLYRYGISQSAILLNLEMPGLDGFSTLEKIQGNEYLQTIPVVVMSDLKNRELCLRALRHGAREFILKPIDREALRLRVASAVGKVENERLRAQNTLLQIKKTDGDAYRTVFENTGTVVVEYDWQSGKFSYDPAISSVLFGKYDQRSLWQIWLSDMVADSLDVRTLQMLIQDLASDSNRVTAAMDILLKTSAKAKHWFTVNAFKRLNEMNLTSRIVLTFTDVNDNILASKKLRFQAEHDSLTGLYNRAFFLRLAEETVSGKTADAYVLLCCDINDFRFINERFGREEGDKLLKYTAEKLLVYAGTTDGFIGRLSNDVYAMLLPNKPGILSKATECVRDFFKDYPLNAHITCRAGAYIVANPNMTADAMLDMASTACNSIRGKFETWLAVYDNSMNEQRLREKEIVDSMEGALAEGQFDVYLQPQFHHATGQILGAEALVRWIDPQKGVIPPGDFIPLFERNGFITKLDEYVWDRTARYLSEWIQKGNEPFPLSVNVSREDLNDPEMCKKLLAIIQKYDIPIHLFRLEITESLFAGDAERLGAIVGQLHEKGFLIEMDDFGSGYSSLNILKDVPVDILKLDMRFFSGSDNLGRGGLIINAVMRMARWLNIPVIAEGVEQKEQADFLLSIGCPTIQGFLYDKPMPVRDFEKKHLAVCTTHGAAWEPVTTELESVSFWNPLSADSQLFNNYIGPAAVLEYHDEHCELVRMNRRFISTVQIDEKLMLPAHGVLQFDERGWPRLKSAIQRVIDTGEEEKIDVELSVKAGSFTTFHAVLRLIAKSNDRALIYMALDA